MINHITTKAYGKTQVNPLINEDLPHVLSIALDLAFRVR